MVCWCPKNDGCCVRSIFLQNHYSTYCDLFISPLYLRLMSSLSAAPPLPKCHRSWWILWLHAFGPCCCIQTSMEGRHCCVPNTSHVAEALRRLPYGRKRSLVIKNDCAGLFASNFSVCVLLGDAATEGHCDGAEWRTDLLQVSERAICEKNAATHIKFSQVLRSTCQILHCHICHLR